MKLSEAAIAAIKDSFGEYVPAKHDKLVQSIIKRVGPFTVGTPVKPNFTKMALDTLFRNPDNLHKVISDLTLAVIEIGVVAQKVTNKNVKKMLHEAIDKAWPAPVVRPVERKTPDGL